MVATTSGHSRFAWALAIFTTLFTLITFGVAFAGRTAQLAILSSVVVVEALLGLAMNARRVPFAVDASTAGAGLVGQFRIEHARVGQSRAIALFACRGQSR